MNSYPLISVIVPVYKVEDYLDRCINSIVNQTYTNIEIILVDDGSPDNCPKMCEQWADKDRRIRVLHKFNEGLGFARNSGLKVANGEYIAFVDSDDYIDFCMYEKLISKAISSHADIVYCGHHYENQNGTSLDIVDFEQETIFESEQMLALSLKYLAVFGQRALMMSVWHSIYKRDVINTLFFSEREVVSEDLHFQLSAILKSKRVVYLPHAYYYYCFNGNSLSHTFLFEKFHRFKVLTKHLFELYLSYEKENVAYYYFFYRVVDMIRQIISNNNISSEDKKNYYNQITKDVIWKDCLQYIDIIKLPKHLKLLYYIFKRNSSKSLYPFALFDYYVVCRKLRFK